ncbi:hypothetical protein AB0L82_06355 [Nocardia sp. NPDC052001]|uniref:hypothetical protein n=1 Tax=unclassified Nocardia TaxID=2637762 RepID=UPI0034412077
MKRTILVGATALAFLGGVAGTAAAEGLPLNAQEVDITPGSASDLGNVIGAGSVNTGSTAANLGSAFSGGYLDGVLSSLSAH